MTKITGNSRSVDSAQTGPHEKLDELVKRYQHSQSKRPVSEHTQQAFDEVMTWLDGWRG